jgi:hypothetical protein
MSEVKMILIGLEIDHQTGNVDKMSSGGGVFTTFESYGDQGFVEDASFDIRLPYAKFRTKKIKGFEYSFEGIFFKNNTGGEEGEKVLRGTLRKFKNGKKLAEVSGDFAYHEPQCWH